jgi:hypothetical protein
MAINQLRTGVPARPFNSQAPVIPRSEATRNPGLARLSKYSGIATEAGGFVDAKTV